MSFYGFPYGSKVRPRWWSLVNWLKGYRLGSVQRHRCCGHTTPRHGTTCASFSPQCGRTDR